MRIIPPIIAAVLFLGMLAMPSCSEESQGPALESLSLSRRTLRLVLQVKPSEDEWVQDRALLLASVFPNTPENASSVNWLSRNPLTATVDANGLVTARSGGDVYVVASLDGFRDSCHVFVSLEHVNAESVQLDTREMKMTVGESRTLGFTISPDIATMDMPNWKSTDPSVASVDDNGTVTALREGEAQIVAWAEAPEVADICVVSVDYIKVSSITIPEGAADLLFEGDSPRKIIPTVGPAHATYKRLVWTSSDPSVLVAGQDSTLTPVSHGEVTVRVASDRDPDVYTEFPVSVLVKVTGIVLDKESLILGRGAKQQLVCTLLPGGSTPEEDVVWSSSNPTVASVTSNGEVAGLSNGETVVTASIKAKGETFTASCRVTVRESGTEDMGEEPWL